MNGVLTYVTIFIPVLFHFFANIVNWVRWKKAGSKQKDRPEWDFYLHFPLVSAYQNFMLTWKFTHLLGEKDQWSKDLERLEQDQDIQYEVHLMGWEDSPSTFLIKMNRHQIEILLTKMKDSEGFESCLDIISRLELNLDNIETYLDPSSSINKPAALTELIRISLKTKDEEISRHRAKMATFRLSEGLLEAAPQALLQSSIQIRDNYFFNKNSSWMDMSAVVISTVSMILSSTSL